MEKIKQFKIKVACDFKDPDDRKYLLHLNDELSKIKMEESDDKIYLTYIGSIAKNLSDNALDFIDEIHKYIINGSIVNEIAYCVFGAIYSLDCGEGTTRIKGNFNRKYSITMCIPNYASHVSVILYQKDGEAGKVFRTMANPRFALGVIMKRLAACGLVADYAVLKLICKELLSRYEDGISDRYVDEITMMDAETKEIHKYNLYFEIHR